MKVLKNIVATVENGKLVMTADISEVNAAPFPMSQTTIMHMDDASPQWICHAQISNHGIFVKVPNKPIAMAVPLEEFILKVARVVEPGLCPPVKGSKK
jgi:hypothetical protein